MIRSAWVAALLLLTVQPAAAAVSVTVNGTSYSIPQTNEKGWGANVTTWIQAISANTLQPSGGAFTLTADLDLGASFGLKSLYYKSRTSNISSTGVFRLANTDGIGFRNAANSGDLLLTPNATDGILNFNGVALAGISATQTLTNKTIAAGSNTISGLANTNLSGSASISNANLATMNAHTFKGNNTGSTAVPSDLTATQLTAELNAMVGDAGSGGTKGLVPAPATGDATKFLRGDGTYQPTGTGTVTSVTFTGDGTILSSTPSAAVTTTGTVTGSLKTQTANTVLAGPSSGGAVAPTFRSIVATDLTGSMNPLIQRVSTQTGAVSSGTTIIAFNDTIPQNTGGDQYMSLAITPKSTTNILTITVVLFGTTSQTGDQLAVALFQDSTAGALAVGSAAVPAANELVQVTLKHVMTAGTTSVTTFKVRAGGTGGTCTFNGVSGGRKYGGALVSSITIEETAS